MAYARMGDDSDVYVWLGNGWECSGCLLLNNGKSFYTEDRQAMIDHLQKHRGAGHLVPDRALARLRREMDEGSDDE